jgi:hypothetical protein
MTDDLMKVYNRSGQPVKGVPRRKLPKSLETALYCEFIMSSDSMKVTPYFISAVLTYYFKDDSALKITRGSGIITTTLRKEMEHQMMIYLSNAASRIKIAEEKRNQKE